MRVRLIYLFILVILGSNGCGDLGKESYPKLDQEILNKNQLLKYFVTKYPGKKMIKYALKDLNDDGREDMLIIYQVSKGKNMMCVVLNFGENYMETNEVPAPISNQIVEFKNIDERPPMEFIVQGMKGAKVGYAIFRIENGKIVDLFGEGMAECC